MYGLEGYTVAVLAGGHGEDPHAEHPNGAAYDLFLDPPRYVEGVPTDGQKNVVGDAFIRFGTYYYGSHCPIEFMRVELSLDGGTTFHDVYLGELVATQLGVETEGYQDGYEGRVFRRDGHNVTFIFTRLTRWPEEKTVYIRFTGRDGYGREAVKTALVTWPDVHVEPVVWMV